MGNVLVLQHVACETLGTIERSLTRAGHTHRYVRPFAGDAIPGDLSAVDALVVMGGPMGVYDVEEHPNLRDELRLIDAALKSSKPVLGVCLGSQLIAAALGATVKPSGRHEIGWHELTLSKGDDPVFAGLPTNFEALHWHGDIFDLPKGTTHLASSKMTQNQAFRFGTNAYALLFHLEVTEQTIDALAKTFPEDVQKGGLDYERLMADTRKNLPALEEIGSTVFGRWAKMIN